MTRAEEQSTEIVPADIEKAIDQLNDPKIKEQLSSFVAFYHHQGPLPPASELAKYNEIIPNGADRIMVMAEKQSEHRRSLEQKVVSSQERRASLGQIFAFILSIAILIIGKVLIDSGHAKIGAVLMTSTLVALVTVFITGKTMEKKSLKKKQE